jgi:hypothetical protein
MLTRNFNKYLLGTKQALSGMLGTHSGYEVYGVAQIALGTKYSVAVLAAATC